MKMRSAAVLAVVASVALGALFAAGAGVEAKPQPGFLPAFEATYPAAVGSRIDSCTLCHVIDGSEYRLNPYARQWKEDADFRAIEALDADGDGFTNIEEIAAHTFPGDPADNPSTVVTTTTLPGTTTTTAPPGSGGAIYQANCAACHGGGGGNLVPTTLGLSEIVAVVSSGRGGMPAFSSSLTAAEIRLVAEYLVNGTAPTTTTTTPGTPPPPPPDGSALFAVSCAGCHGAGGGDLAGTPRTRSQLIATITGGTTTGMPSFSSTYSAVQIDAIAGYLLSLAPPSTTTTTAAPGSPPPTPSGSAVFSARCAACHGASGGNLVGRDLATSRIVSVVEGGTAGMPGFAATLSSAEIDAVVAYVANATADPAASTATTATAGSGVALEQPQGETGDAAHLYVKYCSACHGAHGEGGSYGAIVPVSLDRAGLLALLRDGKGRMPDYATRLTLEQRETVADFVMAMGAAPGPTTGDGAKGGDAAPGPAAGTTTPEGSASAAPAAPAAPGSGTPSGSSPLRAVTLVVVGLAGFGAGLGVRNRRSGRAAPHPTGAPPTSDGGTRTG